MSRYLMSSPTIREAGLYRYERLASGEAANWYSEGPVVSAIANADTADELAAIVGAPIVPRRLDVVMDIGDVALVFIDGTYQIGLLCRIG